MRAHAADERNRRDERARSLVQNANDAVIFLGPDDTLTYASPAAVKLLARDPKGCLGVVWDSLVHPADRDDCAAQLAEARRRPGIGVPFRGRLAQADAWLPAEGAFTNLLNDPNVGALVLCCHAASTSSAPEDWLRVFEAAPGMAAVFELDGTVQRLNPAFARLLGLAPGATAGALAFLHRADRQGARLALRQLRAGREVQGVETRWRSHDGAVRWISWSARRIPGEGLILALGHDITTQQESTESLRRSESLFRQLADAMPQIVWTMGPDGRPNYVNGFWQRYTGMSETASLALGPAAATHPDDAARSVELWNQAFRSGEPYEMEVRLRRVDGSYRWHLARAVCVRDADGRVTRWLGTGTDIHEQKRVEEQQAEAQRIARLGSWHYEVATDQMAWSGELYRIFGLDQTQSKLTYANVANLLGAGAGDLVQTARGQGPGTHAVERQQSIERPDGTTRECRFHTLVETGPDGLVVRLAGIVQDQTHLREKEREIARQAELLNQTLDAIIVRDLDDRVEFWNHGAERILGWSAEETLGHDIFEFLSDEEGGEDAATQHLLAHNEWSGEFRYRTKADAVVILLCHWTLVRDEAARPRAILAVCTDVTEQRRLAAQSLRAQRLESVGTLASGVAHDLNNILAPILMAAPMLRETASAEQQESFISLIETSARRGAAIVRQVLTFARGAEGERILIQPKHLLADVVKISDETFPKSIQIESEFPDRLWTIQGDPTQLHQVLLNLSVNARDAMPDGGTLTLRAENFLVDESYASMSLEAKPGPHVLIEVRDTGTGIAPEVQGKIFEPFFTTKEQGKGTGLGLSTALGLVRGHGGFINVYSERGRGTVFKVFLPAIPGEELEEDSEATPPEALRGNGELILLVDDEPGLLSVCATLLTNSGFRVLTAPDGPGAIAIFAQQMEDVRVLVTDLMMPLMDGVTLIHAIRRMKPEVGIIASTGGSGAESRARDLAALNVTACLTKPYDRTRLIGAILEALNPRLP
ncbi:MAG: PAS domain S-box protein [Verrucomicrobia bacterium]|nr:PAS domain S-box protein [Verrucomicrobiota bacterium]